MEDVAKESKVGLGLGMYSFLFLLVGVLLVILRWFWGRSADSSLTWIDMSIMVGGVLLIVGSIGTIFRQKFGVYLVFMVMICLLICSSILLQEVLYPEDDGDDDEDDGAAYAVIIFGGCFLLMLALTLFAATGFFIDFKPVELDRSPPQM